MQARDKVMAADMDTSPVRGGEQVHLIGVLHPPPFMRLCIESSMRISKVSTVRCRATMLKE